MTDPGIANSTYVEPLSLAAGESPTDQPEEVLPSEYYRPLAKAERLRGQMALKQGEVSQALIHYATAYDYFVRFSSAASELDDMTEMVYTQIGSLSPADQKEFMQELSDWVNQLPPSYRKLRKFVNTLCELLGVSTCVEPVAAGSAP